MASAPKVKAKAKSAKQKRAEAARLSGQISFSDNLDIQHPANALYSPLATDQELFTWLEKLDGVPVLCLDIETAALNGRPKASLNPWEGSVRLIQIGLLNGDVLLLDVHKCKHRMVFSLFLDRLRELCESAGCLIVGHSLKFEMVWLGHHFDFRFNRIMCLDLASRVVWAGLSNYGAPMAHSMDALAGRLLGRNVDKSEQNSAWLNPMLTQSQLDYAAEDVRVPLLCMGKIIPILKEFEVVGVCQLEFDALIVYAEMEIAGIPVSDAAITNLVLLYGEALSVARVPYDLSFPGIGLHSSIRSIETEPELGDEFSYPAGLYDALYRLTGVYPPSLDSEYLETLSDSYPAVESLLVSRALSSSLNYLKNVQNASNGSVVRPGYRSFAPQGRGRSTSGSAGQASEKSRRMTTGEVIAVNIQNPPNSSKARYRNFLLNGQKLPDIRTIFTVGPGTNFPDRVMDCFDFAAAHGRLGSVVTDDDLMMSAYLDDAIDLHCDLAALIAQQNGTDWSGQELKTHRSGPDKKLAGLANWYRGVAKNVFYLWLNGGGENKVRNTVVSGGLKCPDPGALLNSLKSRFEGVSAFHEKWRRACRNQKVWRAFPHVGITQPHLPVRSSDGRIVFCPATESEYGLGVNSNDVFMCFWMGPESSAKKRALVEVRALFAANPHWGGVIWLDCHDEIGVHCLQEWALECFPQCSAAMTNNLAAYLKGLIPAEDGPYAFHGGRTNWSQCK